MPRRLVLFDIDGTLITDNGAARRSYALALRETYGFEGDLTRYDFSGRTDPQIAHMVLRDAGWSEHDIDSRMAPLWETYIAALELHERKGNVAAAGLVMARVAR